MAEQALLEVRELACEFFTDQGPARAVDGVSFAVPAGRTVGIVGESGCGKTATALAIMGLLPTGNARVAGEVRFDGRDLLTLDERALQRLRGNEISMIFQEPMTALNPVMKAGEQVAEVLRHHRQLGRKEARARSVELFRQVGIPAPEERVDEYPHQLSGGMRQRVMMAMALACTPKLLIADEPTTALDVTIQAQILELLRELRDQQRLAILLITHDLGVVARICDEVIVMYAGRIAEHAAVDALFAGPRHPYTAGLLAAIPGEQTEGAKLKEIPGTVPPITDRGPGCPFYGRCDRGQSICQEQTPPETPAGDQHRVYCHFPLPPPATDA